MSSDRGKLGNFLKEVIDWRWDDFCLAESDPKYTGYEAAVFSLVRICSDGKLGAIKTAIDRVDGKLVTPVKIEYPKVFLMYPHAKGIAPAPEGEAQLALPSSDTIPEPEPEAEEESAATITLREMVKKMADQSKVLVPLILEMKRKVEAKVQANEKIEEGEFVDQKVPLVKSVIAANLLHLAIQKNNFEAITEVFDQIDGKLVETFKFFTGDGGDGDIYLTQYALEAPYGSVKNKDGVYVFEDTGVTERWKQGLKKD